MEDGVGKRLKKKCCKSDPLCDRCPKVAARKKRKKH
jgi:hypothetical protein